MEVNNFYDLAKITSLPDEEFVPILQDCKLLKKTMQCSAPQCRKNCNIQKSPEASLTYIFICNICEKSYTLTTGSFFSTVKVPLRIVLHIMWNWACEFRSESSAMVQGVSNKTVIKIYRKIREICSWTLLQEKELLGGPEHVIQIDDGVLIRKKVNEGRRSEEVRMVVIYDTTVKKGLMQVIPERSTRTVQDIIVCKVVPGSEVWTSSLEPYHNLGRLGGASPYNHKIASHSNIFVDPQTGIRKNFVEAHLSRLRVYLRHFGVNTSPFLREYIDQYMWTQRFGPGAPTRFRNLLEQISRKHVCS